MSMKRKILLSTVVLAVVILFTEVFVLNDYLPSIKKHHKRPARLSKTEELIHFKPDARPRTRNKPVSRKKNATVLNGPNGLKTESVTQNQNEVNIIPNRLSGKVNGIDNRIIRTKLQVKPGGVKTGKRVLIYTPLFTDKPWQGISDTYRFTHYRGAPCPVTNCLLTYRHRLFPRSDVVIFHGQDMPDTFELEELNRRRPKGQIWIYFVLESPSNARDTYFFRDMFNWTMTYERNADIFLPYGSYVTLKPGEKSSYGQINPDKKDRLVVWTVSNCGELRDWFVRELKNHIRVDIFGSCGESVYQPHLQDEECEKDSPDCENLLKRYKFQLAFENGNCVDYVTEKYWGGPLELGIVPVVLGGANYSEMAIPGSYINVFDFDSRKTLADYLLYLDKNDTAYMEYFVWRKLYKVDGYLTGATFNKHYPWTCDICAKAQNPKRKSYKRISDFRDPSTHCGLHVDKLYELMSPGGDNDFRSIENRNSAATADISREDSQEDDEGEKVDDEEDSASNKEKNAEENSDKIKEHKEGNEESNTVIKQRKK
ncbi:unnamed protein product [Porites lobata]|uniref:Fucosyltransferase n=1 Tax=Porites lobata TaxID=104759 RepID=A0ABN8NLH1_9CNID|nr:unnamed protein product [Porites lobata]